MISLPRIPGLRLLFTLSAVFLATSALTASEPLAVGATIPDATVLDAKSEPVKLRDIVKTQPAVIVFYRGGWCPYCVTHLAALAKAEADIVAAGFQVLAISPDQPAKLAETPGREKLGYTLLSDSDMNAAKGFGITFEVPAETVSKYKNDYKIDLEAASGRTHHLLPHPAVFIVDTAGKIRFAHVNPDYKKRLTSDEILTAIRSIKK
jgi:peroxiredoxin